jgi:hypothetical protein
MREASYLKITFLQQSWTKARFLMRLADEQSVRKIIGNENVVCYHIRHSVVCEKGVGGELEVDI